MSEMSEWNLSPPYPGYPYFSKGSLVRISYMNRYGYVITQREDGRVKVQCLGRKPSWHHHKLLDHVDPNYDHPDLYPLKVLERLRG